MAFTGTLYQLLARFTRDREMLVITWGTAEEHRRKELVGVFTSEPACYFYAVVQLNKHTKKNKPAWYALKFVVESGNEERKATIVVDIDCPDGRLCQDELYAEYGYHHATIDPLAVELLKLLTIELLIVRSKGHY